LCSLFWCDVEAPQLAPPAELSVSLAMTVAQLQAALHAAHPGRAPSDDRVRLFSRTAPPARAFAAAADVGALGLLSRPTQGLAEAGICAGSELYWASDLMRFQADPCAWAAKCNAAIGAAKEAAAAAKGAAAIAARARFWPTPHLAWPHAATTGASPVFYASESRGCGDDGAEIGSSLWLRLRCAGDEAGRFELHAHRWSDMGRKSRHNHALTVGQFRLAPARAAPGGAPGGGGARSAPAAATLSLMPTAVWGSATQPPIAWSEHARFRALPRETTDALAAAPLTNSNTH
jgi:hypothetical protein